MALADEQLARAMRAFHLRSGEDWTVETLAKAAGMSRTLFSQRMSMVLGMSPMEYVTQWHLESTRKALADRRGSVPEIAESLGYQSVSAFRRAFKKKFGRGPGEVRRGR